MQIFRATPQKNYAVIDAETTELEPDEIPLTKFWGYADCKRYEKFSRTKDLVRFLHKQQPTTLLHHTNFDLIQFLVDGFESELEIIKSHNGKIIRGNFAGHTTQNTYCTFPEKLEKIFKAFGYKKTSLANLEKRNYEDCVNGLECFLELDSLFLDLVDTSPLLCGTVAGTTFKAAEKHSGRMPKDLRFLNAYRGGRVEVWNTNRARCSKLDIRSSYPRSFLEAQSSEELWKVKVKTRDWYCPLFDSRVHDMLLFPNGTFTSYVFKSNWEKYLEPYCEKTSIKILSRHKLDFNWIVSLRELVLKIYGLKADSDNAAIRTVCKYLLNAFYGRIGLSGETERCRIMDEEPDGEEVIRFKIGKRWICFDTVIREPRSNFGFAAFITDNARARLYQASVLNQSWYGDTDSLWTLKRREDFNGQIGNRCGDFEYQGRKTFRARNVKDYEWDGEQVVKGGIPGKLKRIWTMKTFGKHLGVRGLIRERKTGLRKREILPNGETIPLTVN